MSEYYKGHRVDQCAVGFAVIPIGSDGESQDLLACTPSLAVAVNLATSFLEERSLQGVEAEAIIVQTPSRRIVWDGRCRKLADLPSNN